MAGWADWQFMVENGTDNVFYKPNDGNGKNLYIYRGERIGLTDKVFASLRMKSMRRGAQDYEMLRLLALKDGNDKRAQAVASRRRDRATGDTHGTPEHQAERQALRTPLGRAPCDAVFRRADGGGDAAPAAELVPVARERARDCCVCPDAPSAAFG